MKDLYFTVRLSNTYPTKWSKKRDLQTRNLYCCARVGKDRIQASERRIDKRPKQPQKHGDVMDGPFALPTIVYGTYIIRH